MIEQACFDAERVQQMFKDATGPYSGLQASIQKSLNAQRPFFETIARHANELTKAFESIHNIQNKSVIADIQERIKSKLTDIRPLQLETAQFHEPELLSYYPTSLPAQTKVSEERIAELVFQKINDIAKNGKTIIPHKDTKIVPVQDKTLWEDIKITFKNDFDVMVYIKNRFVGTYSHSNLKLVKSNSDGKPDRQWDLLKQLAILCSNPGQMIPTPENLAKTLKITKEACMKAKGCLSKKLQFAFGLEDDPFREYDKLMGYRPKFQIESETVLRSAEPYTHGRRIFDIMTKKK